MFCQLLQDFDYWQWRSRKTRKGCLRSTAATQRIPSKYWLSHSNQILGHHQTQSLRKLQFAISDSRSQLQEQKSKSRQASNLGLIHQNPRRTLQFSPHFEMERKTLKISADLKTRRAPRASVVAGRQVGQKDPKQISKPLQAMIMYTRYKYLS